MPAGEAPVIWQPDWLAEVVTLVPAHRPAEAILRFDPPAWRGVVATLVAEDGAHVVLRGARGVCRLWLPGGLPPPGTPLVALVDLDPYAAERAAAVLRFWRIVRPWRPAAPYRRAVVPDGEIIGHILTLRALDGSLAGASYRAIAEALFGAERVAREPWKTSSVRAQVIRLVAKGRRLMRGGYRDLLKPPKRRFR